MPRLLKADAYQKQVNDIVTLAVADVVGLTTLLRDEPLPDLAGQLRTTLPAVATTYGTVTGQVASTYYDSARADARLESIYASTVPELSFSEKIQANIGYAIGSLVKSNNWDTFVSSLSGGMQQAVTGGGRETISYNIVTDPDGTMYQRVPSANACSFCMTVASVAELQTEDYYTKYHDFCHCRTVPVFTGQQPLKMPYYEKFQQEYTQANNELVEERAKVREAWLKEWKAQGGRTGKNLTRDFARANPDYTLTTENILRIVRKNTGRN